MIKLGSHVSMSAPEYVLGSVKEALGYNANALMLYTGAPQNSNRAPVEKLRIEEAKQLWLENGNEMKDMIVHAPYIINLANTVKPETFDMGVEVLGRELERSAAIGARYLVLHPGSYLTATLQEGIDSIIKGLNIVLSQHKNIIICLETMAGKGKEVGFRFEQIAQIIQGCEHPELLGVCLDSCHIWDSGYDLNDLDFVLKQFDEAIGLDKLYVIHVNDSKNELSARKDRHANIGDGFIGKENLIKLVHHPLLEGKTMILETPYIDKKAPYKEEIELLKKGV